MRVNELKEVGKVRLGEVEEVAGNEGLRSKGKFRMGKYWKGSVG